MTRSRLFAVFMAVVLVAGLWTARRLGAFESVTASGQSRATGPAVMSELAQRDLQIEAWTRVATFDTSSAMALGQLAALYVQRGRESGEYGNYLKAEEVARRSLAIRTNRNDATYLSLTAALLAQHRFPEARGVAERIVAGQPEVVAYRAMLAEIQMELGDYAAAKASFDTLYPHRLELSVAPRAARFGELMGFTDYARKLLRSAVTEAGTHRELPREQVAWFDYRLGDLELRHGRLDLARQQFQHGLAVEPNDYRLLAAMARLESVRHQPERAIEYGERAIAVVLDPATLGIVGDAYAAIGDHAKAEEYYRTMEVAVGGQPGPYHRAWSLFLLDHGRRSAEVLAKAQEELATRPDIYGYDLLAWALHIQHRDAEAAAAMAEAMSHGAEDAALYYHAGMIARARGRDAEARAALTRALTINAWWHAAQPDAARAVLDSLHRERGG